MIKTSFAFTRKSFGIIKFKKYLAKDTKMSNNALQLQI